jgi:hypothetical protein
VTRCLQVDGRIREAVRWLEEKVVLDEANLYQLLPQHVLAGAYQADGQVWKAVELLEHVVTVEGGFLRNDHFSRLASLTALTDLRAELRGGSNKRS